MKRASAWLVAVGVGALLISWPLWHVTRFERPVCSRGVPCDAIGPKLPFGGLALTLDLLAIAAFATVVVFGLVWIVRAAVRLDASERHAA